MYVFLLILGAVIAVAGVLIAAAGLPILGHEFDASIITPGAVAVVGGLILIGLGLAVRALSRIEQALATRPLPRSAHSRRSIRALRMVAAGRCRRVRISFPPRPEARPQPAPAVGAGIGAGAGRGYGVERLREQFPTLVRLETARSSRKPRFRCRQSRRSASMRTSPGRRSNGVVPGPGKRTVRRRQGSSRGSNCTFVRPPSGRAVAKL